MISTEELVDTIRAANGETRSQTLARIDTAARNLGIEPVDGQWHDDDADEICLAVRP